jgi:hypothetical protein
MRSGGPPLRWWRSVALQLLQGAAFFFFCLFRPVGWLGFQLRQVLRGALRPQFSPQRRVPVSLDGSFPSPQSCWYIVGLPWHEKPFKNVKNGTVFRYTI